jgi:hypothetical protein
VTTVASLDRARARRAPARRTSGAYVPVDGPVDVALLRISRQLAARSMTVREAADHIRSLYLKTELGRARAQCANLPGPLARAHFVAESARAARDVLADEFASQLPLALAERCLGQVLVLPCGERVGPTEKPYDRPEDLW